MNAEDIYNRIYQRQRTKSEAADSKIIRKSTHEFSSIKNLEDLLECPIHLGIMNEPTQLHCGHAFCLSCLDTCVKHVSEVNLKIISCPLCRKETQFDETKHLVPSYLHKHLNEYLLSKKRKLNSQYYTECTELNVASNNNLFKSKVMLVNDLLNDIKNEDISLDDLSPEINNNFILNLQTILEKQESRKNSGTRRFRSKSLMISDRKEILENLSDSKFDFFDQNTIRKNMRKYREYILTMNFSHYVDISVIGIASVSYGGSDVTTSDKVGLIYIMKDSPFIYLANSHGLKIHSFAIDIDGADLIPVYVKCHSSMIFISGKLESQQVSYLIQLSLHGVREKCSQKYLGILGGFCFDMTNKSVFITYPSKNQVLLFDESLQKELKVFEFGDLSPMFVALSVKTREIWVTCPGDGRIAVYDELTNNYLHLATDQIYNSTPTHIIETGDNRLLFLDVGKSRLFWILRWNNCLFIQLMMVMGTVDDFRIDSIESFSHNMILFSDGKKTYFAKPNRTRKEEHQKPKCVVL